MEDVILRLRKYALRLELTETDGPDKAVFYTLFPEIKKDSLGNDIALLTEIRDNYYRLNGKRANLINKDADKKLDENERAELEQLQKRIGDFIDIMHPLPMGYLEEAEEKVRKLAAP